MHVNLGIDPNNIQRIIQLLNTILADETVLYIKTLNYHWNVHGPHFDALHLFFRRQYEDLFEIVDVVAERIRTLGGKPLASMHEYLQATRLPEDMVGNIKTDQEMLAQLLQDHETVIRTLRKDIMIIQDELKDIGTANLLTDDLLEKQEKIAWMLRASLVSTKD